MVALVQKQQQQVAEHAGVASKQRTPSRVAARRSYPRTMAVYVAAIGLAALIGMLKRNGGLRRFVLKIGVARAAASPVICALVFCGAISRRRSPLASISPKSSGNLSSAGSAQSQQDLPSLQLASVVGASPIGAAKSSAETPESGPSVIGVRRAEVRDSPQSSLALTPVALSMTSDIACRTINNTLAALPLNSGEDLIPPWCAGRSRDSCPSVVGSESSTTAPFTSEASSPKSDVSSSLPHTAPSATHAIAGIPSWCSGAGQKGCSNTTLAQALPAIAAAPAMAGTMQAVSFNSHGVAVVAGTTGSVSSTTSVPDWCRGSSTFAQPTIKEASVAPQAQQASNHSSGVFAGVSAPSAVATTPEMSIIPDWCAGQSPTSSQSTVANATASAPAVTHFHMQQFAAERKAASGGGFFHFVSTGRRASGVAEIPAWCAAKA